MSLSYLKAEQKPLLRVDCSRSTESHSMWYTQGTPQHHGSLTHSLSSQSHWHPLKPLALSDSYLLFSFLTSLTLLIPPFLSLSLTLCHSLSLSLTHSLSLSLPTSVCSWLSRAIETAWLVLDELDLLWLPIIKTWRLNERYCSPKYIALPVFIHRVICTRPFLPSAAYT